MRNYPAFPRATPHQWAGSPRVPHPSATFVSEETTFDLHALGTPPALILSQDQTLHQNCRLPSRSCDRTLFHVVRASSTMRLIYPAPERTRLDRRVGPPSSAAHSAPRSVRNPRRPFIPKKEDSVTSRSNRLPGNQPVNVRRVISARAKENRPYGRAALGLERICVSAPIVVDDLQSETLRLLARARFGACQQFADGGRL
jgi:hypothetical protein